MEGQEAKRQQLEEYLTSKIDRHRQLARQKRWISSVLLLGVLATGAVVLVNVGTKWLDSDGVTAVGGLGAALLAVLHRFRFQEWAKWNKLKQRALEGLRRELIFEDVPVADVSRRLTKVQEKFEAARIWFALPEEASESLSIPPKVVENASVDPSEGALEG